MKKIFFEFGIGDLVMIKGLDLPGEVDALILERTCKQYRVIYWYGGERKDQWLNSHEIEERDE